MTLVLATAATTTTTLSLPVLANNKNNAILPPSMRAKIQAVEESSATVPQEVDNYRLFEEWKKSKGDNSGEYEEFLLWQEFRKTQQKN